MNSHPEISFPRWAIVAIWRDGESPVFAGADLKPRDSRGRFCGGEEAAALKPNAAPTPWPFARKRGLSWLN